MVDFRWLVGAIAIVLWLVLILLITWVRRYEKGYFDSYRDASEAMCTRMRQEAIGVGVARYIIDDSMTGTTKFEWITPADDVGGGEGHTP